MPTNISTLQFNAPIQKKFGMELPKRNMGYNLFLRMMLLFL
ncbi:MAG: hypothetical protein RIQ70_288 [Bacteroidota bacterium]